jgi:hypothetical protein
MENKHSETIQIPPQFYVDESGEIKPLPEEEQAGAYYHGKFFNEALKRDDSAAIIDKYNRAVEKLNLPINSREVIEKGLSEEEIKFNATLEAKFHRNILIEEFGFDYTLALLDVALETKSRRELSQLFSVLDNIRIEAPRFARIFGSDRAPAVERAIGQRTSEVLFAIRALNRSNDGRVAREFAGVNLTISRDDNREVQQYLAPLLYLANAIDDIDEAVASGEYAKVYDKNDVRMYQLGPTGSVLFKIRPTAVDYDDRDESVEYSGEAQVNFAVDMGFDRVPPEISDPVRNDAISLRIDRDGRIVAPDGSVSHDPTAENLTATFDIGSIFPKDQPDNPNFRIAEVITLGNILRSEENGDTGRGYHTSLSNNLSSKESFAELATEVERNVIGRNTNSEASSDAANRGRAAVHEVVS